VSERRRLLANVVLLGGILAAATFLHLGYQAYRSDSTGASEDTFHLLIRAGAVLGVAALLMGVYGVLRSAPAGGALPLTGAIEKPPIGLLPEPWILARVSVAAGVLSWLPLIPLLGPPGYALLALLAGWLTVRRLAHAAGPDRLLAVAGILLGGICAILQLVTTLTAR